MFSSGAPLLSHLAAAAADRDPGGPALVGSDETLDHESFARRVAQLGSALVSLGVAPGDRVAVFAPKSIETFVAMHASMYAGAIAAPVDPFAPEAVVSEVVRELAPTAVVLAPATAGRWPAHSGIRVAVGATGGDAPQLAWDEVGTAGDGGPVNRRPSDPAYVLTTSGSTGRPKCITHTHASGLRYAELAAECYELRPDDRMANVAPFHFDQSTFELYAAPLAGAATVLVPDVLLRFPAGVSELLERERVTTWYSVPTILQQLLERGALDRRDLSALRWVLFGGELFPPGRLRQLMALLPGARFSNAYGPAEVNQCTHHHLSGPPVDDAPIPIGVAWPAAELRLVDADEATLEGAAQGELLVSAPTAMAGYWGRPDLDERAFVTDGSPGGRRWYRTGDVVDRDDDGLLTFVGRIDRQVKVRGVRVELESVESVLGSVAGVTGGAAVVVDDPDAPFVALVESTSVADVGAVRQALRAALPPAAIPDRIVIVPALPRSTSGKVDSNAAADLLERGVTT
ncbi:MAG: AMP-binding protein [Ilumatobacteraceae bacterium]